jgi:DNA replication and repair protein RecF
VFQFRNLEDQRIDFSPHTNLLAGLNGQGKTNFLEAVYLLGYGRSFRTPLPRECIRHGKSECRVDGKVGRGSLTREIQVSIGPEGKRLSVYGKPVGLEEFAGTLHVLAFAHEHLKIIRGGPGDRRSFLDRAMIALYPGHIQHLASYSRALKQRNKILAEARIRGQRPDESILDSWDQALVNEGARILWNRLRYVAAMKRSLPRNLFGPEEFRIDYQSSVGVEADELGDVERAFSHKVGKSRSADLRWGSTTVGPHRDNLRLLLDGKPVEDFASSGQQRSCLLSLYFSQMEIHIEKQGFYPVFLIDDFEAELDESRLRTFLSYLAGRAQIFLTTAKAGVPQHGGGEVKRFEVLRGKAEASG